MEKNTHWTCCIFIWVHSSGKAISIQYLPKYFKQILYWNQMLSLFIESSNITYWFKPELVIHPILRKYNIHHSPWHPVIYYIETMEKLHSASSNFPPKVSPNNWLPKSESGYSCRKDQGVKNPTKKKKTSSKKAA
jgi:hypothetical protein